MADNCCACDAKMAKLTTTDWLTLDCSSISLIGQRTIILVDLVLNMVSGAMACLHDFAGRWRKLATAYGYLQMFGGFAVLAAFCRCNFTLVSCMQISRMWFAYGVCRYMWFAYGLLTLIKKRYTRCTRVGNGGMSSNRLCDMVTCRRTSPPFCNRI